VEAKRKSRKEAVVGVSRELIWKEARARRWRSGARARAVRTRVDQGVRKEALQDRKAGVEAQGAEVEAGGGEGIEEAEAGAGEAGVRVRARVGAGGDLGAGAGAITGGDLQRILMDIGFMWQTLMRIAERRTWRNCL